MAINHIITHSYDSYSYDSYDYDCNCDFDNGYDDDDDDDNNAKNYY